MNRPEVNVPLLRKAVEWAEVEALKPRELSEWEQGYYVLPLTSDDPILGRRSSDGWDWVANARLDKAPECGTCYCIAGYTASIGSEPWNYGTADVTAQEALGLTDDEAIALFRPSNTIGDVRSIAEKIAGENL